jgi:hypothetical protein
VGEARLAVYSNDPDKQREEMKRTFPKDKLRKKMLARERPAAPQLPAVDCKGKWFPIPGQFSKVDESGLHVTINRGPNTYDIEMK